MQLIYEKEWEEDGNTVSSASEVPPGISCVTDFMMEVDLETVAFLVRVLRDAKGVLGLSWKKILSL